MMKPIAKLSLFILSFVGLFFFFSPTNAYFYRDDNSWELSIDFRNTGQWIQSVDDNVTIDTLNGNVSLNSWESGSFTMANIQQVSFKGWWKLNIWLDIGNYSDVSVEILDCDGNNIWSDMKIVWGNVELSGFDSYDCLKPKITINGWIPAPVISSIKIDWEPLSYVLKTLSGPSQLFTCESKDYSVWYSVNYVNDKELYIWIEQETNWNNPLHFSLNNMWSYSSQWSTSSTWEVKTLSSWKEIIIPANTKYWYIDAIEAGKSSELKFIAQSDCGLVNWSEYNVKIVSEGNISEKTESNIQNIVLKSNPYFRLEKSARWLILDQLYTGYNDTITYNISYDTMRYISNKTTLIWVESSESIILDDNLTSLKNKIDTFCPWISFEDRILNISNWWVLSGSNIFWDIPWGFGKRASVSFQVNFENCDMPTWEVLNNSVSWKNIGESWREVSASDSISFTFLNDRDITERLTYSKTAPNRVYHDKTFSYRLNFSNIWMLAAWWVVMFDRIPDGLEMVWSASLSSSINGKIFYSTDSWSTIPEYNTWFALDGNFWTNWSETYSADAKWIWVYVECLNSSYFKPTDWVCAGKWSYISLSIPVIYPSENAEDVCKSDTILNVWYFWRYSISEDINNNQLVNTSINVMTKTESTVVERNFPWIDISMNWETTVEPNTSNVSYQIKVVNNGWQTSKDTEVKLTVPYINVNWEQKRLFVQIQPGGGFDATIGTGEIIFDVWDLLPWEKKSIDLVVTIPKWVYDWDSIRYTFSGSSDDPLCGKKIFTDSFTTTIRWWVKELYGYMNRDLSLIEKKGTVEYTLSSINLWDTVTKDTYMVWIIPDNMEFQKIITSGTWNIGTIFNCDNCDVLFAPASKEWVLPGELSTSDIFNANRIFANFTPGTDNWNWEWTSPFADTKYYAIKVNGVNWVMPTGVPYNVGMIIKDNDHQWWDIIDNQFAIFSRNLNQSITNTTIVWVYNYPGARWELLVKKEIVEACESNLISLNYYSDVWATNEELDIKLIIPKLANIEKITHEWNWHTVWSGTQSGEFELSNSDYIISQNENWDSVIDFNAMSYLWLNHIYSLQWWTLRIYANTDCDAESNTILEPKAEIIFWNPVGKWKLNYENIFYIQNADLQVNKNVNRYDPIPGDRLTYTLDIVNQGQHEATNVTITDNLPLGTCYVTWSTAILTPDRSIWEPTIASNTTGDCTASTKESITWNMSWSNTLINSIINEMWKVPGDSEVIQLQYKVYVTNGLDSGDDVINDATVITSNPEDDETNNSDNSETQVPYPDLTIDIDWNEMITQWESFGYNISYSNLSRKCASNAYFVHKIPDDIPAGGDWIWDFKITSVNTNYGDLYYSTSIDLNSYSEDQYPTFDKNNFSNEGWILYTWWVLAQPIQAIAVYHGDICKSDGIFSLDISGNWVSPVFNNNLPIWYELFGYAKIFHNTTDLNDTNNVSIHKFVTPGVDLAVDITWNLEWWYPWNIPWWEQSYTINYKNEGTQNICNVWVKVDLPTDKLNMNTPSHNFDTIELIKYETESATNLIDVNWNELTDNKYYQVSVTSTWSQVWSGSEIEYKFVLWWENSENVCLPPRSYWSFELYTTVNNNIGNETSISANTEIGHDSLSNEVYTVNNFDDSSVLVYRADTLINKIGYASKLIQTGSNLTGDTEIVSPGEFINYKIDYDNIWNANASGSVITDNIPKGECYVLWTLEDDNLFADISYSNNWWSSYNYNPADNWNWEDCNVSNFKITFNSPLTAKTKVIGEDSEFDGNLHSIGLGFDNITQSQYLQLDSNEYDTTKIASNVYTLNIDHADLDWDGLLDIVTVWLLVKYYIKPAYVYFSNPDGSFYSYYLWLYSDGTSNDRNLYDMNNDWLLDIVIMWSASSTLTNAESAVFFNNWDRTFTKFSLWYTSVTINALYEDFNDDGYLDIFAPGGRWNNADNFLFMNNKDWTFTKTKLNSIWWYRDSNIAISMDADNDGDIDILSIWHHGNWDSYQYVTLFKNDWNWNFSNSWSLKSWAHWSHAEIGDFNNDGFLDFVVWWEYNYGGDKNPYLYVNNWWNWFSKIKLDTTTLWDTNRIILDDLNKDWKLDIVISYSSTSRVFINEWDNNFKKINLTSVWFYMDRIYDYNNDWYLDILWTKSQPNKYVVFLWNSNWLFTEREIVDTDTHFSRIKSFDIDWDWDFDIINPNSNWNPSLFINDWPFNYKWVYLDQLNENNTIDKIALKSNTSNSIFDYNWDWLTDLIFWGNNNNLMLYTKNPTEIWSYISPIFAPDDIVWWNSILLNHEIKYWANIEYSIYDASSNTCNTWILDDTEIALIDDISIEWNVWDISDIDTDSICIVASFSIWNDNIPSPKLFSWYVSYYSNLATSFTYSAKVSDKPSVLNWISLVDNQVSITTSTPEISQDNNSDNHIHRFWLADVQIDKSVNTTSAHDWDTLNYTLSYTNNWPADADDVVIIDKLPSNVSLISSSPNMTLSGSSYYLDIGTLQAYATWMIDISVSIDSSVNEWDLLINNSSISTSNVESDYSNNDSKASTIIWNYANMFTTINCPVIAPIGESISCSVSVGNNWNAVLSGGTLDIWIDDNFVLSWSSFTWSEFLDSGMDCVYDDISVPNKISCDGWEIDDIWVWKSFVYQLDLLVKEDYNLIANTNSGTPATNLIVSSHVANLVPEVTNADNSSFDNITPVMNQMASIAGEVFVDVDGNNDKSNSDRNISWATICITWDDVQNNNISRCVNSNIQWEYLFDGLLPGDYNLEISNSLGYPKKFSDAGISNYRIVEGEFVWDPSGIWSNQDSSVSNSKIINISLDKGEKSIEQYFGLKSLACDDVFVLDLDEIESTTSSESVKISGSVDKNNVSISINWENIVVENWDFDFTASLVDWMNKFDIVWSNWQAICEQSSSIYITKTTDNGWGGGWWGWGGWKDKDKCPDWDYSASFYDNDCGEEETGSHGSADGFGKPIRIGCRYSDENYVDRGPFEDTLWGDIRGFNFIEEMRLSCIHRGRWAVQDKWTYEPNSSITKAEVMKTMAKLLGIEQEDLFVSSEEDLYTGNIIFVDIPEWHWASWYSEYAFENWLLDGLYEAKDDGLYFYPEEDINRTDAIKMMVNTYEKIYWDIVLEEDFVSNMNDITIDQKFLEDIFKAEQEEFIEGRVYGDIKLFEWNSHITRQEFAKIAYKPFAELFVVDVDLLMKNDDILWTFVDGIDSASEKDKVIIISAIQSYLDKQDDYYFFSYFNTSREEFMKGFEIFKEEHMKIRIK